MLNELPSFFPRIDCWLNYRLVNKKCYKKASKFDDMAHSFKLDVPSFLFFLSRWFSSGGRNNVRKKKVTGHCFFFFLTNKCSRRWIAWQRRGIIFDSLGTSGFYFIVERQLNWQHGGQNFCFNLMMWPCYNNDDEKKKCFFFLFFFRSQTGNVVVKKSSCSWLYEPHSSCNSLKRLGIILLIFFFNSFIHFSLFLLSRLAISNEQWISM